MTAFSSVNSNATSLASAMTSAVAAAKTLSDSITPASIGALTLAGLATSTTSWRSNVADCRIRLTSAIDTLATANRQIQELTALIGNIATLD